jgi:chromosome segregation ATPase
MRPLTAALDDSLASIQAAVVRVDERLAKNERAFGGFEKQINAVETMLVAERQARDEQAKAIGEIKAITDDTQGEALRSRLVDLAERLGKSEQALSGFEKQMNDILASLSADRESREEQARLVGEMKTMVESLSDHSAQAELAGLTERLANVETTTDKFEQYRKAFETALMANRQLQLAQSQTVNTQLKTITQGLRNTLGYDVKKNFKCDSCGADGAVALRIRCTHCEKENWWGWWPKDKS